MLTRISAACFNSYESSLFTAAFTLAFCRFLRVRELAVEKKKRSDCNKVLAVGDATFSANYGSMYVRIRYSKADQAGVGVTLKFSQTRDAICPVQCMRSFLLVRPKVVSPLFCHIDGSPLTSFQFSEVLQKVLKLVDNRLTGYKSHSFRIGAATRAAQLGWSAEEIKRCGRWASEVYRFYVKGV